jgi:lysophospholipase
MKLVALAKNPVPSGAIVDAFAGYDGKPMRYARWEPTRGPQRGTVCVFTGRAELIEKYFEVVADLQRRGFAVAIMDWRGQGGSYRALRNPKKGWIRDFSEYERDLAAFMRQVVEPDCPAPYFALAHSMGGNVLLRYASRPTAAFSRIVLSAPMVAINEAQLGTTLRRASLYAGLARRLGFGTAYVRGGSDRFLWDFEGNEVTSDPDRFARNRALAEAAPHLMIGSPTIAWLDAALRSCRKLNSPGYPARIKVPLLIFTAGRDTVVDTAAAERFASRLKVGTLVTLPTAKHEILQETDEIRSRFWAAFDAYLGVDAAV